MEQINKGYLDNSNVVMTNRKFKKFDYLDDAEFKENPLNDFRTEIKINTLAFYRVLEMLNKINQSKIKLTSQNDRLNLSVDENLFKLDVEIKSTNENEYIDSCLYSVDYLINFFKEYSIKELKEEEFISLSFADDYPLKIKFKNDWLILAPRVEMN